MAVDALIVDDAPEFRFLLRKRLEQMGCRIVAEASNSKEGLELFRQYRPRLVTLDLIMPDAPEFNAQSLFRTIRREAPETAIVVISVNPRSPNAAAFLASGATAYIQKAFMNFDEMRRKLHGIFPEIAASRPHTRGLRQ